LFQFMGDDELRDLLRDVQDILGDRAPQGGMGAVVNAALTMYKATLEKDKYALTDRPREPRPRSDKNPRYIPAYVRRAVRKRDGDQCTFVGDHAQRCGSRRFLEFDHIVPVARGGESTVDNVRLRCRAHNQYEAERVFGDGFMAYKRESASRTH
jgi:hypothetical protein